MIMKMDTRNMFIKTPVQSILESNFFLREANDMCYIKTKEKLKWTIVAVCPRKIEAREGWH